MGINLKAGGRRTCHKMSSKTIKTNDPYIRLLIKLYNFLERCTESVFCATVVKHLHMSKVNAPPTGLYSLSKYMKNKSDKTAVIVGKVTDDVRVLEYPKLSVCALKLTETARKRILAAGRECLTFDQLALRAPKGSNTVLLCGNKSREALSHFGHSTSVLNPHTHNAVKPFVRSMGRKFERERGRSRNCGFKL